MIITIDWLAWSGKSSLWNRLSKKYWYPFIIVWLLYRHIAHLYIQWKSIDEAYFEQLDYFRVIIPNKDILINDNQINNDVSLISQKPHIREFVNTYIRNLANRYENIIFDGRSLWSDVFPDANIKIFLMADEEVRKQRKIKELHKNIDISKRDKNDKNRKIAPILISENSLIIDTSFINKEQVYEKVIYHIGD